MGGAISLYENRSLQVSDLKTRDVLMLAPTKTSAGSLPLPYIPTGTLTRGFELAKFSSGVGKLKLKKTIQANSLNSDALDIDELARLLNTHLGALKGLALKFGQIISYMWPQFGEDMQHNAQKLQDRSTPLCFDEVSKVVETELKRPLYTVFSQFENEPVGVGSIGQVHKAQLHDGRWVAVKVQFPSIESTIASDFKMLKALSSFAKILFPQISFGDLLDELQTRMIEECDYRIEGQHQGLFAKCFADDPAIVVPEVVTEFLTKRLLVTEYIEAKSFREFAATATAHERNVASATLFRITCHGMTHGPFFNGDPNPGNFLFQGGKVVFLDFGCVKVWHQDDRKNWSNVARAIFSNDRILFESATRSMGIAVGNFDFDAGFEAFVRNCMGSVALDTAHKMDAGVVNRDIVDMLHLFGDRTSTRFPPQFLIGFRVYWGMFRLLSLLGGEVNWRQELLPIINPN